MSVGRKIRMRRKSKEREKERGRIGSRKEKEMIEVIMR